MKPASPGFTLLELLLALSLGAVLLTGLLQLTQAVSQAVRGQQALAELRGSAAFALRTLRAAAEPAGFRETPWDLADAGAIDGSASASDSGGVADQLVLRRWSRRNCLGNGNPERDSQGKPAAWLLETEFTLRDSWRLVVTCRYGPAGGPAVRQLNATTLVTGVERFRVRYGEDRDGDRVIDDWRPAEAWVDPMNVLGLRVGLVLASTQPVGTRPGTTVRLHGQELPVPADGRLRLAVHATVPLRGRLR